MISNYFSSGLVLGPLIQGTYLQTSQKIISNSFYYNENHITKYTLNGNKLAKIIWRKTNYTSSLPCAKATATDFQKLFSRYRAGKNCSLLHGVPAKLVNRKIARILRVFNFSAIFQKLLHFQRKTHKLLVCNSRQHNYFFSKNWTCSCSFTVVFKKHQFSYMKITTTRKNSNTGFYFSKLDAYLTLLDMEGGGAWCPKMFLATVPKCLGGGSWNLVTFNINLEHREQLFLVP